MGSFRHEILRLRQGHSCYVDISALKELGLDLSYTPGRNAVSVAEFTIGLMLSVIRSIGRSYYGLRVGEHVGKRLIILMTYQIQKM